MAKRARNMPEHPDQYEELVSQTGLGRMRDWGTGMMSIALAGKAGTLWAVRMVDGSVAVSYVWEEHELWYANVVLFEVSDGQTVFDVVENLGPFATEGDASHQSGVRAGEMALKHRFRKLTDEAAERTDDEEKADGGVHRYRKWWSNLGPDPDKGPMGL